MPAMNILRCAYCHAPGDVTTTECKGCGTLLHTECWALARRCPTLGCGRRVSRGKKKPVTRRFRWEAVVSTIAVLVLASVVFTMWRQQPAESPVAVSGAVAPQPNGTEQVPPILNCRICELELADDPNRSEKASRVDVYWAARYRDGYTRTTHFACSYEHREALIRLRQSER